MARSKRDIQDTESMLSRLTLALLQATPNQQTGANYNEARADAEALRRISMTLHRWHELECGDGDGHIERDEKTGRPRYFDARSRYLAASDPRAWSAIPDREAGARKRLAAILARYPGLQAYVQTDPRGCALYILRPGDVPNAFGVWCKSDENGQGGGGMERATSRKFATRAESEAYAATVAASRSPEIWMEHGDVSAYYSRGIAVYK